MRTQSKILIITMALIGQLLIPIRAQALSLEFEPIQPTLLFFCQAVGGQSGFRYTLEVVMTQDVETALAITQAEGRFEGDLPGVMMQLTQWRGDGETAQVIKSWSAEPQQTLAILEPKQVRLRGEALMSQDPVWSLEVNANQLGMSSFTWQDPDGSRFRFRAATCEVEQRL